MQKIALELDEAERALFGGELVSGGNSGGGVGADGSSFNNAANVGNYSR